MLAHEAAHIATGVLFGGPISHPGPEFRAVMADVTRCVRPVAAGRLVAAYRDHGLGLVERHWPEPTPQHDRGIYGRWRLDRTIGHRSAG